MKFGVREVADITFKAKSNLTLGKETFEAGEPVIFFDSAKTSTMESSAATVYAQGGKGNARLLAWEGDKTATFTFEEALLSPLGFQVLSGAGVIDASTTALHHTVRVQCQAVEGDVGAFAGLSVLGEEDELSPRTATNTLTITEDMLPAGAKVIHKNAKYPLAKIFVMALDANGEIASRLKVDNGGGTSGGALAVDVVAAASYNSDIAEYTGAEGIALTITGEALTPGTIYLVDLYCEVKGTEMTVESGKFAGYYYIEANTLFRRASDGMDVPAQFTIPKGKIQSNFTFTMAGTGDPSTFTFTVDAFPDYMLGATQGKKVLFSLSVANDAITQ